MNDPVASFERTVLPHLDDAYTLARWLVRNPDDARDVVQEALTRALRYFSGYRGGDGRAWLLSIVRNTCVTWFQRHQSRAEDPLESDEFPSDDRHDPAQAALRESERLRIHQAIANLPLEYREVIVLRELEALSYKEIAEITGVPLGTVMSRLARARSALLEKLERLRSLE